MMQLLDLSAKLKAFRSASGLSVSEAAKRIGVAESTYREWEYGRSIKGEPYVKLAEIYGVSLSELLIANVASEKAYIIERLRRVEQLIREIRVVL